MLPLRLLWPVREVPSPRDDRQARIHLHLYPTSSNMQCIYANVIPRGHLEMNRMAIAPGTLLSAATPFNAQDKVSLISTISPRRHDYDHDYETPFLSPPVNHAFMIHTNKQPTSTISFNLNEITTFSTSLMTQSRIYECQIEQRQRQRHFRRFCM